jgi:hypothetical protein
LIIGPFLIFTLSIIAKEGTLRVYQRFLEAITEKAKLDQALGFNDPNWLPSCTNGYWLNESFLPTRFLSIREKWSTSSKDFIDYHLKIGYHGVARKLFSTFQFIAILLAISLLIFAGMGIRAEFFSQSVVIQTYYTI